MLKTCSACGDPISERSRTGLCKRCRKRAWRDANPEKAKACEKACRAANPEKEKARSKAWRDANPEKIASQRKARYDANPEKEKARRTAYRDANPDYWKAYYAENAEKEKARKKVYRAEHPDKCREWRRERRTYLCAYSDCKKINKWFLGCDFHHLTPDTGVHIPAEMHNSVYHNLRTGQGMEEMETKSMEWLQGVRRESPQTTLEAFG